MTKINNLTPAICLVLVLTVASNHLLAQQSVQQSVQQGDQESPKPGPNLLTQPKELLEKSLQWMNPPAQWDLTDEGIFITAPKGTDFFIDPENGKATATAPLLYKEIEGDFVATARMRPDFSAQWNACALMLIIDQTNWIKLAFEHSDATGPGVVSVVTRGVSDDANGVALEGMDALWLKLVRKGEVYGMFWSADGKDYRMVRITRMEPAAKVKVGLEAQCPVGEGARHQWKHFSVEQKTVQELRKGV